MILSNLNIRYINLARSKKRKKLIEEYFKDYHLIRIPAIDGIKELSDSTFDNYNRPVWKESKKQKLIDSGIIAEDYRRYYDLFPSEVGCNSSHVKAWNNFLDSKEEYSIFIEDDVVPVKDLKNIETPDDADVFYLAGTDHKDDRINSYPDGQVKWSRTLMAYIFSRRAAELAIEAAKPFYYQTDLQVPLRIYKSYKNHMPKKLPRWTNLNRIKAYVPEESYIVHSEESLNSTFTKTGTKVWLRS